MWQLLLLTLSSANLRQPTFPLECSICKETIGLIQDIVGTDIFYWLGSNLAVDICELAANKVECEGFINLYGKIV